MNNKKAWLASVFENNIDISMGDLSTSMRKQFGKGAGFVELKRLREAWLAGSFDRVWDEVFRDEPAWERSVAQAGKTRGDRRKKLKVRGRRGIDKDKISLSDIRGHLVVYRSADGFMNSQQFDSRKRAEELVKQLLSEGIPADRIGWFRRNELTMAA